MNFAFDIDGQRYRVDGIQDFAFIPGRDDREGGPLLMLQLIPFGPPAN